jgi:hypothetical protein
MMSMVVSSRPALTGVRAWSGDYLE